MQFLDSRQEQLLRDLMKIAGNDAQLVSAAITASAARHGGTAKLSEVVERIRHSSPPASTH